jgi:hypothetical protein
MEQAVRYRTVAPAAAPRSSAILPKKQFEGGSDPIGIFLVVDSLPSGNVTAFKFGNPARASISGF